MDHRITVKVGEMEVPGEWFTVHQEILVAQGNISDTLREVLQLGLDVSTECEGRVSVYLRNYLGEIMRGEGATYKEAFSNIPPLKEAGVEDSLGHQLYSHPSLRYFFWISFQGFWMRRNTKDQYADYPA